MLKGAFIQNDNQQALTLLLPSSFITKVTLGAK